jgi:HD-GYP domain-containing protein (c-di-GMP phosphodiesterase class II)
MTSDRPYRQALTREQALAEVERCAGTQFDPEIARIFLEVFGREEKRDLPAAAAW